jgi:hypothetical protein
LSPFYPKRGNSAKRRGEIGEGFLHFGRNDKERVEMTKRGGQNNKERVKIMKKLGFEIIKLYFEMF